MRGGAAERGTAETEDAEAYARAHLRHNVVALGADFALFLVGLSFASASTILPAFAVHLGAPNVVIGAIPAVMTTGWFLPSLFAAGHTETLARRLPFVLRYTVWERAPFVVLALVAFTVAGGAPTLALAALLGSLVVVTGVGGVLLPAWMDIIGRTIPTELRGRFFAISSTAAGVAGLSGSFATAAILGAVAAPASYGICFLIASAFMGLSYVALAVVREPAVPVTAAPTSLGAYLGRMPAVLRRDPSFAWFVVARALGIAGAMASGFFVVYALAVHAAPARWVGLATSVLFLGNLAGTLAFGWLADRAGHRLVVLLGAAALVVANVVALAAPTLETFTVVFALAGVYQAAAGVSNLNVLLEFAPAADEQPTYVGLGNTLVAPVAFGAPLVAGLMADAWGFERVFVAAAVFGLAALAVLVVRVREPRFVRRAAGRAS